MCKQLVRCGNHHGSELVQAQHGIPELVMPLEYQHDAVALPDAKALEVVRTSAALPLHVQERYPAFRLILGNMKHCQLVGIPMRQFVHDVVGEVELLGVLECYLCRSPVLIQIDVYELMPKALAVINLAGLKCHRRIRNRSKLRDRCAGGIQDYRVELAVMAVDCNHSVRRGRAEVDAVSRTERCAVLAHLNQKVSRYHKVQLLPVMACQLDVPVLGFLIKAALDVKRLGDPVLKGIGKVVVGHPVGVAYLLPASGSGDGK